uniref:hypothetical protein n=1 Tax=Faecalibacterium sp. TaxID=1971605 RepID=UPI003FEF938D
MKKRLLSLLVAISMVLTFLPVSALTAAAAEDSSNGELKIGQNCYPVLDNIPHQTVNEHDIYTGDGWTYDADENCKILTLCPSAPTNYDFFAIHTGHSITTDCNLVIGKNATVTDGNFIASVTNNDTIKGGIFKDAVTNHGTIIGGRFFSSVTNELDGIIENGQFGDWASSYTVTNNGGTINGGTFKEMSSIIGTGSVASGYTLAAETPSVFSSVSVNGYHNSCYIIPNQASVSVDISYRFDDTMYDLPPLDVTIDNAPPTLLSDWCGSDLKIEFDDIRGVYEVTFTAPPANGSTVTISPLTRLVIDKAGYPVGTKGGTQDYSGNGWKFENGTLTLESGDYDFSGGRNALRPLNPNVQLVVESGAKLTGGAFAKEPTGEGAGTFKKVTLRKVTLNGTDSITAVNGLASGDWGNTLYVVKTGNNTITASKPILDINRYVLESDDFLYPDSSNKSTISLNIEYLENINFIASDEDIVLNQASYDLPLEMANDGTPIINDNAPYDGGGGYYNYYGDGWYCQKATDSVGTLYLTGGKTYNFRYTYPVNKTGPLDAVNCGIVNEYGIIEDGIFNTLVANGWPKGDSTKTHEIEGGTFAAGLLYNDGVITGGAFNGKDSVLNKLLGSTVVSDTALSGDYRSVTVKDGAILKVNDTFPLIYNETTHDLVQGLAWDLYSYAGTVLTVESNVDITNINGQEIGEAFSSYYLNGETDKKVVRFVMPDSDVELNSTKIVVPDPKPEPKPEPEPEAPTYTLTVKGGTFTYNGGEAMTSANVPVDAEVKVTLNQSAVPEGMVFDLWAMDEASLLGNPAVAYNEESFTIPAGSVAKGSTVTVEAQYRDATIESEPSILGTAAIIGVAGAGTAVIVWQGYRIGMELYEKYFQPTPEETAAEQPAPEAPAAAAS